MLKFSVAHPSAAVVLSATLVWLYGIAVAQRRAPAT